MEGAGDELTRRAQARVGRTVKDKWRLDRLLGVGGMASVYAATHRNGKRVAVKWLHPELSIEGPTRARFLREGYIANKVAHRGAVPVLDDEVADDGSLVLVMELLEGETLEARWRRAAKKLPAGEVVQITAQVLDLLISAHQAGIVHRDLKPENLFLTREGVVKVLDFGIARLRELSTRSGATGSRASLGTPAFMPPEQARGRWDEVDERTDLWAVGATIFTLLSGRYVHEAVTTNEQLLLAMTTPAPSLKSVAPGVPEAIASVVDRALAHERTLRWPDAGAMQRALHVAYRESFGAPLADAEPLAVSDADIEPPSATATSASGRAGRRLPDALSIFVVLAALGLGSLVVVAVVRTPNETRPARAISSRVTEPSSAPSTAGTASTIEKAPMPVVALDAPPMDAGPAPRVRPPVPPPVRTASPPPNLERIETF